MYSKNKLKGFSLIGTVAAIIAWIVLSYGIFTVQSSQFQILTSTGEASNAQKLAEADAALLKLVNYENVTNNSSLEEVNLHLDRGDIKSIPTVGWEDEIIISEEKLNKNNPDYGRFRVATINIYKTGDTVPRYSMQTPISKSRQTYSRDTIDEFIEALRAKDRELEAKDRELEATDKMLEKADKMLEKADQALEATDQQLMTSIQSMKANLMSKVAAERCACVMPSPSQSSHAYFITPEMAKKIMDGDPKELPKNYGTNSASYTAEKGGWLEVSPGCTVTINGQKVSLEGTGLVIQPFDRVEISSTGGSDFTATVTDFKSPSEIDMSKFTSSIDPDFSKSTDFASTS